MIKRLLLPYFWLREYCQSFLADCKDGYRTSYCRNDERDTYTYVNWCGKEMYISDSQNGSGLGLEFAYGLSGASTFDGASFSYGRHSVGKSKANSAKVVFATWIVQMLVTQVLNLLSMLGVDFPNVESFFYVLFLTMIGSAFIFKMTSISKWHAAEHMTIHAVIRGYIPTVEHARKMPKISRHCGTNRVTSCMISFALLTWCNYYFLNLPVLSGLLLCLVPSCVLGVFLSHYVGPILQYTLLTSNPSDHQLQVCSESVLQLWLTYKLEPTPKSKLRIYAHRAFLYGLIIMGIVGALPI